MDFQYDENRLLQDVSLDIKKGECVGIFGPNGGGKTTFLKLLMGSLKPSKGTILMDGLPPNKRRHKMGYVPQISNLDRQFPITALNVVKMGGLSPSLFQSFVKGSEEEALGLLDKVGLKQRAHQPFGSLSGGQCQRVLIARALMGNPDYLLLDEATANVDPEAEKEIRTIIQSLKGLTTIIMVTHDLPSEISYIDRFFCVYGHITTYSAAQMCDHFQQGLYHPPLKRTQADV